MGLDAVEIVMDVESHFGIAIQDTEAERVRTVGDLVGLIRSRVEAAHVATCPTLASFLRLRSSTREIANNHQLCVRTGTRVVDVLDSDQRRALWTRLDEWLGSTSPELRRPLMLRRILVGVAFSLFVSAILAAAMIDFVILPLTVVLAAIITTVLHRMTVSLRSEPPDDYATFGAIARRIAGVTVATKQLHLRSEDAILEELRPIIAETLGVPRSEIVLDARFIEDLGMQ